MTVIVVIVIPIEGEYENIMIVILLRVILMIWDYCHYDECHSGESHSDDLGLLSL
jgi:hypothetical protein